MKFHIIINFGMMCKCIPFQLIHFTQLSAIKDALMDDMCQKSINMLLSHFT